MSNHRRIAAKGQVMNKTEFAVQRHVASGSVVDPIKMADGEEMSVQASKVHYCAPREDQGPWTTFEVGFPTFTDERFGKGDISGNVFGWVSIETIVAIIEDHGGIV